MIKGITERLRGWIDAAPPPAVMPLLEEAAAEIDRLRLTDKEIEAIAHAAICLVGYYGWDCRGDAKTLRDILARHGVTMVEEVKQ